MLKRGHILTESLTPVKSFLRLAPDDVLASSEIKTEYLKLLTALIVVKPTYDL